jgi:hypothetical protein
MTVAKVIVDTPTPCLTAFGQGAGLAYPREKHRAPNLVRRSSSFAGLTGL